MLKLTDEQRDDFPTELVVATRGMKVGGAPLGTDEYVVEFVRDTLECMEERITAVRDLHPQVGFGLLRMCVASAPIFLAQVTPPLLTGKLFTDFNVKMVQCGLDLLVLPGAREPSYSSERRDRAIRRLQLPLRHKGAGISSIDLRHPLAYFSSLAGSMVADDVLAEHIDGLSRFAEDTHTRVIRMLGPSCKHTMEVEDLICRSNSRILLSPQHFRDVIERRDDDQKDTRMQRLLTHAAESVRAARLHDELASKAGHMADCDLVHACSRDQAARRFFTAPLSDRYNRLTPFEFVAFTRRILQLPPLMRLNNAAPREGFDYDMEECLGTHAEGEDRYLDLYGCHGNGRCGPASHGVHKGHSLMKYVYNRFANMVPGVLCHVEPKTHKVLLDQFSQAQCRKLFPKKPSRKRAQQVKTMLDDLDEAMRCKDEVERKTRLQEVTERMDALSRAHEKEDKKAVRLDLHLKCGEDDLLVDCSITHSLSKSHRRAEAKRTWERLLTTVKSVKVKPAAAVEARSVKYQTYSPLLYVMKKQVIDGRRRREPQFTPAVATSFGELGPGCTVVQEWLAMRYKEYLKTVPERPDGYGVNYIVGKFRRDLRVALTMALVRRAAAIQLGSGLPNGSIRGAYDVIDLHNH